MRWLLRFLPSMPWLLLAAFVAGGSLGGWTAYRIVKGGEVRALEARLKDQRDYYLLELDIERKRSAKEVVRVEERIKVKEVIRHVKDDAVCDLPADVAGVLDARLQGHPLQPDSGAGAIAGIEGISQSQSLNALDYAAEQFYRCRDLIIAENEKRRSRER